MTAFSKFTLRNHNATTFLENHRRRGFYIGNGADLLWFSNGRLNEGKKPFFSNPLLYDKYQTNVVLEEQRWLRSGKPEVNIKRYYKLAILFVFVVACSRLSISRVGQKSGRVKARVWERRETPLFSVPLVSSLVYQFLRPNQLRLLKQATLVDVAPLNENRYACLTKENQLTDRSE